MKEYFDNVENYLGEIPIDQEAEEQEWRRKRLGKLSGSISGDLVKQTKDKKGYQLSNSETAKKLLYRIAWERFLSSESDGINRLSFNSKPTDHGREYEEEAIKKYEEIKGIKAIDNKFNFISHNDFFGGTPDAFVGDHGFLEVKCPWNGGNHIYSLLEETVYDQKYFMQIQSYFLITGRLWCDFITYDPDLPEGLNISILRIERDENIIEAIQQVIDLAIEKVREIMEQIKEKLN